MWFSLSRRRTSLLGLALGTLYIVAWLYKAGVSLTLIAITIPATVVIYIALALVLLLRPESGRWEMLRALLLPARFGGREA